MGRGLETEKSSSISKSSATMKLSDNFELEVWMGDWGLPSIDVDCLKILSYAKFNNISLNIKATNNPFKSPNGQLPILRYKNSTFCSVDQILDIFKEQKNIPDNKISRLQNAEITAFSTMLEECISPALRYLCWVDRENLNQVIRPWYCKALPFPWNFYYPGKYEKQAKFMTEILYPNNEDKAVAASIYSKAQKCITTLSTRLGETEYFFGSTPTLFDSYVFSYLAPLLKIPLPSCALQNHLKACSNLVEFITRILKKYFEDAHQDQKKSKFKPNIGVTINGEIPNARRNQILAGTFAATIMFAFGYSSGAFRVRKQTEDYLMDIDDFMDFDKYD